MEDVVESDSDIAERVHRAWVAHHERLWRSVFAWAGDRDVASDAISEAFAQALRRGDAIEDVGRWVWRSAFRIAAGLLERERPSNEPAERADGASLPDDVVVLLDALDRLSGEDRTVVVLTLVGGWPAGEVARLTNSTAGAVRVRLHRARRRLRMDLEVSHD